MASIPEIVRQALIDTGLVVMPQSGGITPFQPDVDGPPPCFVGHYPDAPDRMLALFGAAGVLFGTRQRDRKALRHRGLRFWYRDVDLSGDAAAEALAAAVNGIGSVDVTVGGVTHRLQSVYLLTDLAHRGEEVGKRREVWHARFRVAFRDSDPLY